MVTKGDYLARFESAIAGHLGVKHAIAVSSCTSGLMIVHKAMNLTGSVVVPSFTFMATISSLVWAGLNPIYADVDPRTTNLDVASAEAAIDADTTAIVAVHNFGAPANIAALEALAKKRGLKLIFDAAHGFGAKYGGVPVGGQGDAHVYSLSPTKLLIAGEGGIVATNDDSLAARVRIGREYGNSGAYDTAFPGLNARMPEFSAILGTASLANLENAAACRNSAVSRLKERLANVRGIEFQYVPSTDRSSYKDLSLVIGPEFGMTRDELARALDAENIDTRKYYDPPAHRQTAYRQFVRSSSSLANTDMLAARSLSLPIWSHMPDDVIDAIGGAIEKVQHSASAIQQRTTRNP
ncbi:MAG: DegT/DnrJ/EryC1/StrS family aminotransferase [Cyanobacteria bacterium]|nr:DegT/DnrJ/EryC1/StrS family aminotransferase [Cyanobacteriota bacterium]